MKNFINKYLPTIIPICKLIMFILGVFGAGMMTAATIEYGVYFETIGGIILGVIVAVCTGISICNDIRG